MQQDNLPQKKRYHLLDNIRGLTLLSMIAYHGTWDLVYLYGVDWKWYEGTGAYIWQQSICWTFILLSGFCWSLGKKPIKRGLYVFGGGAIVTLATLIFMWDNRVIFGILTLLGSCMLLMVPLDKLFRKFIPEWGLLFSIAFFVLTRNCNRGYLGYEKWNLFALPQSLYRGMLATYFGFPSPDFFSTDYFSIIPWMFLFWGGYFIYQIFENRKWMERLPEVGRWPVLNFLGRQSLVIYLLHQPVLYLLCETWNLLVNIFL